MSGPGAEQPDEAAGPPLGEAELAQAADQFNEIFFGMAPRTWGSNSWLGTPIRRYPTDMLVLQEIVVETAPELIVETGVLLGGGARYAASLLDLVGGGEWIGVDIDLSNVDPRAREHERVTMIEGSSVDGSVISQIWERAEGKRTMVILDSDHSAAHVRAELEAYAPLVSPGCYLVVEDTIVNGRPVLPEHGPGPAEAIDQWMAAADRPFDIDLDRERYLLTTNKGGWLRRRGELGAARGNEAFSGPEQLEPGYLPVRGQPAPTAATDEPGSLRHSIDTLTADYERRLAEAESKFEGWSTAWYRELERHRREIERLKTELGGRD